MNRKLCLLLGSIALIVVFGSPDLVLSASSHDSRRISMPEFPVTNKKWTHAFYLAGENVLEFDQERNLKEIIRGAAAIDDANIVVFFDRDEDRARENLFTSWKGTRLFYIHGSYREILKNPLTVSVPRVIARERFEYLLLPEIREAADKALVKKSYDFRNGAYRLKNIQAEDETRLYSILAHKAGYLLPLTGRGVENLEATSAKTLQQFVSFVKDNFISTHYSLIITGHGNGWFAEDDPPSRISTDQSADYHRDFDVPDIQNALTHNGVDALILDMCHMADIETAWALKDSSGYLAFNQTSIPSMGLDYTVFLRRLAGHWFLSPAEVAREAVETYRQVYRKRSYPVSATAIRLDRHFTGFVHQFQRMAADPGFSPDLKNAARQAVYVPGAGFSREKMVDLLHLIGALKAAELDRYLTGKSSFVLDHWAVNTELSGISVYLPRSRDLYLKDRTDYSTTDFSRDFPSGWTKVLSQLYE